jgi:hypothetical protein
LFGLLKGAVKGTLVLGALSVVGLGYAYYRLAAGKVPAPPGAVVTTGVCKTTPSVSGGTLPVTFEAYVKDEKAHNWLLSDRSIGLVRARYEWSAGRFDWVEDAAFREREPEAVRGRKILAAREVGALVRDLRSPDPVRREVSAKELEIRTGQTLGYRYDLAPDLLARAAGDWERWVQKQSAGIPLARPQDDGRQALETLRRATGQEERK